MTKEQENFILKIILSNTQGSAFQRANVYVKRKSGENKKEFARAFRHNRKEFVKVFHDKLRSLRGKYSRVVAEDEHIKIIKQFQTELSNKFPAVLHEERMRLGIAQKAVNLYLKFLWCLGFISHEPPHCPVDGTVLSEVGININWTELDNVQKYEEIIDAIKAKAKEQNQSIAEWELNLWK